MFLGEFLCFSFLGVKLYLDKRAAAAKALSGSDQESAVLLSPGA